MKNEERHHTITCNEKLKKKKKLKNSSTHFFGCYFIAFIKISMAILHIQIRWTASKKYTHTHSVNEIFSLTLKLNKLWMTQTIQLENCKGGCFFLLQISYWNDEY